MLEEWPDEATPPAVVTALAAGAAPRPRLTARAAVAAADITDVRVRNVTHLRFGYLMLNKPPKSYIAETGRSMGSDQQSCRHFCGHGHGGPGRHTAW